MVGVSKDGRNSFRPYENLPVGTRYIASVLSRLDTPCIVRRDLLRLLMWAIQVLPLLVPLFDFAFFHKLALFFD